MKKVWLLLLIAMVLMMLMGCAPEPTPKVCKARYHIRWDTGGYRPETGGIMACTVDIDENGVIRMINEYGKERIVIADKGVLVISER